MFTSSVTSLGCRRSADRRGTEAVGGAFDAAAAAVEDVRVDHRGADVAMPEQLLDGPDVVAGFEQMGGEAVAQRMRPDGLVETGRTRGELDRALQYGLVHVVS